MTASVITFVYIVSTTYIIYCLLIHNNLYNSQGVFDCDLACSLTCMQCMCVCAVSRREKKKKDMTVTRAMTNILMRKNGVEKNIYSRENKAIFRDKQFPKLFRKCIISSNN